MSAASLEEQSFVNLVRFYEPELRRVLEGPPAPRLFSQNERMRLRRLGVFITKCPGGGGTVVALTVEALDILESPSP